ncbi:ycf3-interacting protein 1, chloroplastic-like [Aristolochia californica]|uniref:ycf3-interacting protein 1, chloroplastic-like n=1 Tax=Aristolochia californica TaxID=171875 RepID=UPI0035E20972
MALQLRLPVSSSETLALIRHHQRHFSPLKISLYPSLPFSYRSFISLCRSRGVRCVPAGKEETQVAVSDAADSLQNASPEDLDYVRQIKRILELLRKNRDMVFGEVKLTIMIDDPRDAERKKLLGLENAEEVTRDDLATALEDVHEGRIPENRVALRLLAEEMTGWPNLEVEAPKKKPTKSLYARATDTGIDPAEAARRLNLDWDTAAEIEGNGDDDDMDVPPVLGYGALYLVTALPVIIGISVVLILFYNSLQ